MAETVLNVEILTPVKTLYKGSATSLSSENNKGKFDILPHHGPIISIIKNYINVVDQTDQKFNFTIQLAVMECIDNHVRIFIGFE